MKIFRDYTLHAGIKILSTGPLYWRQTRNQLNIPHQEIVRKIMIIFICSLGNETLEENLITLANVNYVKLNKIYWSQIFIINIFILLVIILTHYLSDLEQKRYNDNQGKWNSCSYEYLSIMYLSTYLPTYPPISVSYYCVTNYSKT